MSAFLLATALAVVPPAAAPTHTVTSGESLTSIAECELGDANRVTELLELNAELLGDPDVILPGWELALPDGASGECPQPTPTASPAPTTPAAAPAASSHSHNHNQRATERQGRGHARVRAQSAGARTGSGLGAIRQCESGGDYGAVSANGKYRGAYQFDRQTWASVGGSGDPAAASAAEQDRRAQALRQQRGSSPWPSCG
ncbi:MAG: transglycosylase family protein [Actinobacteria bacterium]|nr:transglycosylase family protein [Actinomycetota bacterium]